MRIFSHKIIIKLYLLHIGSGGKSGADIKRCLLTNQMGFVVRTALQGHFFVTDTLTVIILLTLTVIRQETCS